MTTNARPADPARAGPRELEAAHEIARAFLAATHPIEVYRLALARLTPMVRADFGAVFLRDEKDRDRLRPICVHGWPQSSARYLGVLRIRVGLGPTGHAVGENVIVEVDDILADESLSEWWEPARELGFRSLITIPLATPRGVSGAISFYFRAPHRFGDAQRRLLTLIAEQLAATTQRASLVEGLRAENDRLRREGERLETRTDRLEAEARAERELLATAAHDLGTTLASLQAVLSADAAAGGSAVPIAASAARAVRDLTDLLELRLGHVEVTSSPGDAVRLARLAVAAAGPEPPGVAFSIDVRQAIMPVTTDGPRVVRLLTILLGQAYQRTTRGAVILAVEHAHDGSSSWIEWIVRARGFGVARGGVATGLETALAGALAAALGGTLTSEVDPETGSVHRLRLPIRPA